MPKKSPSSPSILSQAMAKGSWYSFLFFLFLAMSIIPLLLFFLASILNLAFIGIIITGAMLFFLVRAFKRKKLFPFCRLLIILNLTLWFLFGFFTFIQAISKSSSGLLTYLILLPYALVSGLLSFSLLSKADNDSKRLLKTAVLISSVMAFIAAVNGAVVIAARTLSDLIIAKLSEYGVTLAEELMARLGIGNQSPILGFFIILVAFNIAYLRHHYRNKGPSLLYLWYLLPIGIFLLIHLGILGLLKTL